MNASKQAILLLKLNFIIIASPVFFSRWLVRELIVRGCQRNCVHFLASFIGFLLIWMLALRVKDELTDVLLDICHRRANCDLIFNGNEWNSWNCHCIKATSIFHTKTNKCPKTNLLLSLYWYDWYSKHLIENSKRMNIVW